MARLKLDIDFCVRERLDGKTYEEIAADYLARFGEPVKSNSIAVALKRLIDRNPDPEKEPLGAELASRKRELFLKNILRGREKVGMLKPRQTSPAASETQEE
jgi:hypothetical protein